MKRLFQLDKFPEVFSERVKNLFNDGFSFQYALETACKEFVVKPDKVRITIKSLEVNFVADGEQPASEKGSV